MSDAGDRDASRTPRDDAATGAGADLGIDDPEAVGVDHDDPAAPDGNPSPS